MSFESALHHLAEEGVHHGLEAFASDLDAEWVREGSCGPFFEPPTPLNSAKSREALPV